VLAQLKGLSDGIDIFKAFKYTIKSVSSVCASIISVTYSKNSFETLFRGHKVAYLTQKMLAESYPFLSRKLFQKSHQQHLNFWHNFSASI
jgi:hypothetical protein